MIIIKNDCLDPAFNLAAEEYLIDNLKESAFVLWRNKRAVIVGKNQNTAAEIDRAFCEKNGIDVIRRLTGGGAVFHDLGNVNYTVIEENSAEKFNNYSLFTADVIGYLETLGVKAQLSGRNDILLDGKKITGNAQCVRNGKIMHHGCILYSADLSALSGALKVNPKKIESKGIKSVSSRVINICEKLDSKITVEDFIKGLENYVQLKYNCKVRKLSSEEKKKISELADKKYRTFAWNYGESPDYDFNNTVKFPFGLVSVLYKVSGGVMSDVKIFGDFFGVRDISELEIKLNGVLNREEAVTSALKGTDIDLFIKGCTVADLIKIFF